VPTDLDLDLGELRLAALAWGPPDGRPVLALHGWLDNAASFSKLAPRLCEALGLRLVALDMPGHGMSEHKRGPYHFIDSVADAIHAADALGWDRFTLLGHSMGAGIASLVAGTIPERIERCVLIEGLGPMVDEPTEVARRLARSLRAEARVRNRSTAKRAYPDPETAVERLLEAAPMQPESARILIARGLEPRDGGWQWRADPRLRLDSRLRLSETQVLAFLEAITCPVLLVSASEGWPYPPAIMAGRVAAVGDRTRVELPGRHHLHLDDPATVAEVVISFLADSSAGEAAR
jgi:pimeloyl-ACP methyl ester carboxylesterase